MNIRTQLTDEIRVTISQIEIFIPLFLREFSEISDALGLLAVAVSLIVLYLFTQVGTAPEKVGSFARLSLG